MQTTISKTSSAIIFILFLVSMNHWIGWHYRQLYSVIGGLMLIITFVGRGSYLMDFSRRNIISAVLLYFGFLIGSLGWRGNVLAQALYTQIFSFAIPAIVIICLDDKSKMVLLDRITKWFAWLMFFSLIIYILSFIITLPDFGIVKWHEEELQDKGYGICYNYLFYLKPVFGDVGGIIERFRGPFLEPGHLGTVCGFLLFANHHDYKKRANIVIMITLFVTLSLAGWMLWVVGFLFCRFYQGKMKIKNMVAYIILVLSVYGYSQFYNDGDNIINNSIVSRLEGDSEKGIVGNNRNTEYTDVLFATMWTDPQLILNGYSDSFIESANSDFRTKVAGTGIVRFLVLNGLVGLMGAWFFYIYYAQTSRNKKFARLALLFFILCFAQRCYFHWYAWILCYCYAIAKAETNLILNKNNNYV